MDDQTRQREELEEAIAGARARILSSGLSVEDWLARRFAELNATQKPAGLTRTVEFSGRSVPDEQRLVAVPLIVQSGTEAHWGRVDDRTDPGTYIWFTQKLLEESTNDWLDRVGSLCLERYDGPLGPIYSSCGDTRHRLHTVKALGLPFIPARIVQECTPRAGDQVTSSDAEHLALLRDLGYVTSYETVWPSQAPHTPVRATGTLRQAPAVPWALEPPAGAARLSQVYAAAYPAFRAHPFYELTRSVDAATSLDYQR